MQQQNNGGTAGARIAARIGGAAADFVAGLGRKAAELQAILRALVADPARERGREELRRKLHALGVGARLLHLEVLARSIGSATTLLDEAPSPLPDAVATELDQLLTHLPERAGTTPAPPPVEPAKPAPSTLAPAPTPWVVLLIGGEAIARAREDDPTTFPCELERTTEVATALELARALAPDLVVVDVDLPGALELVSSLVEAVLTGPTPVVTLGSRLGAGDAPRIAQLLAIGVAKVIEKPVAPTTLREACGALDGERSRAMPSAMPDLGAVTPEALADRLTAELRRLLVDQLEPASRGRTVDLGLGAEVLGPFWGALARIRDVVRERSQGAIGFRDDRLQRPIAISTLGANLAKPDERRGRRREALDVDLEGRTIVVADDDAAVSAYVASALREAGATVHEAEDGVAALALARAHDASAIVTDVLMPRLDGVGLARALRRDVALRDRPVVLLSWKEDLLQRLRDLRVSPHATLHKDDDARTIVARVREVLAPRVRVEARVASGAEVRGRLDDLTVASLLAIVDRVREDACVVIRDAANVFEVELERGGIRKVTRTGADPGGSFATGPDVLPAVLGAVGGRFLVRRLPSRSDGAAPGAMHGELDAQLAPTLRALRAACDAVARVLELTSVGLDPQELAAYLPATPPAARAILERLAGGASPRAMLLAGEASPAALEDLLVDVASRGVVRRAVDARGVDLLAGPTEQAPEPPQSAPPAMFDLSLDSLAPPPPAGAAEPPRAESDTPGSLADAVLKVSSPGEARASRPIIDTRELRPRSATRSDPPPERTSSPPRSRKSSPDAFSATPTPRAAEPVAEPKPYAETLHGVAPVGSVGASRGAQTMPPPRREREPQTKPSDAPASEPSEEPHPEPEPEPAPDSLAPLLWTFALTTIAAAVTWYVLFR